MMPSKGFTLCSGDVGFGKLLDSFDIANCMINIEAPFLEELGLVHLAAFQSASGFPGTTS